MQDEGGASAADQRATRRLPAIDRRARIGWREAGHRVCTRPALLVDISEHGACVLARTRPSGAGPVWIGLMALDNEWVRATVRAVRSGEASWVYCHLAFTEPCPAGLLEQAAQAGGDEPLRLWGGEAEARAGAPA